MLLITLLAVVVPILLSRFTVVSIPIVVGEIVAGIVIGQSGLNLVEFSPTLNFLSEFGFAFLMFLSGLEVDISKLSSAGNADDGPGWKRPVPMAFILLAITIGLALVFGYALTALDLARSPLLMALILSTTSLGIVVPILKERGISSTKYGQAVLVAALVSDFVTLLLLSMVIAVLSRGLNIELLLFMALIVAFLVALRISRRLQGLRVVNRIVSELSHATAQIRVRGSLALLVIFVVLAESLGVELILGAFLAGVLVSILGRTTDSALPTKLDAIGYGFFIPVFFITVGAKFDLASLAASPAALLLVPLLIFAAYAVKLVPALIFRSVFTWRESIGAGFLLSSRLSLIIAASEIALGLGLISTATNSAVILIAIVTCTLSPLLFQWIVPIEPKAERSGIVIYGTHQLAKLLAQRLYSTGEEILVMSQFADRLATLPKDGYRTFQWITDDAEAMKDAGLDNMRALIAVANSSDILVDVCRVARDRYGIPTVIANTDDPEIAQELQKMGVGVVRSTTSVALALEGALLYPSAYDILLDKQDGVEVADIPLSGHRFSRVSMRNIHLPGNALVVGVRRNGETMVPHGDTVVHRGETLIVIGDENSLAETREYLTK